jgi:hypothetical protein
VELTQCPYDHTTIEAEAWSGGSIVLSCPACDAAWEWHGAWLRRVREPHRDKMIAARNRGRFGSIDNASAGAPSTCH